MSHLTSPANVHDVGAIWIEKEKSTQIIWPKCLILLVRPAGFPSLGSGQAHCATYGFVDEARLAKSLKSLEPEKTKLLFFASICNLYATIFHVLQRWRERGVTPLPPFDPILTSIFKNKEAPLSP